MRMLRRLMLSFVAGLLLLAVFGCSKAEKAVHIENANDISILYGVSSYAMFGADDDVVQKIVDSLNGLTFEKTEEKIDLFTAFSIGFFDGEKAVAGVSVDQNGVFWLDGTTDDYKVSSGTFDYDYVQQVYLESKTK